MSEEVSNEASHPQSLKENTDSNIQQTPSSTRNINTKPRRVTQGYQPTVKHVTRPSRYTANVVQGRTQTIKLLPGETVQQALERVRGHPQGAPSAPLSLPRQPLVTPINLRPSNYITNPSPQYHPNPAKQLPGAPFKLNIPSTESRYVSVPQNHPRSAVPVAGKISVDPIAVTKTGAISMFTNLPAEFKNSPELSRLMDRYKSEHEKRKLLERERNDLVERLDEEKRANVEKFHEIERLKLQVNQMVHEMKRVGSKLGGYFDVNDQLVKTKDELMLTNVSKNKDNLFRLNYPPLK